MDGEQQDGFDVKPPSDGKENPGGGCLGDAGVLMIAAVAIILTLLIVVRGRRGGGLSE